MAKTHQKTNIPTISPQHCHGAFL